MARRRRAMGGALAFAAAAALCGCAVGPDYRRPAPPAVTHYGYGGDPAATDTAQGATQRFMPGGERQADWWHLFESDKLDAVVGEALTRNPGMEAAQASLRSSEDGLRSGYGIFFPQASADAGATRQQYAPVRLDQNAPPSIFNLFTLSASVNYALDVFGGERRLIESLRAQVDLQRANEQATFLALAANIVNTVIARAAYGAEVEATRQLIELESDEVRIAGIQSQAGTVPYSTVLSLQSQLASYQATIPQLEQKLAQCDDLLATLVGLAPAEWQPPDIRLADLTLPRDLPVTLPSELVEQRPDIRMAEAAAHAASATIGVATAALLPSVTLSANYAANGVTTGTLFAQSGRSWDVAAGASAPLFQGGTLWYRRRAAIDNYQQAAALYRQTVLSAFAQVADTLRALEHDAASLAAEDAALGAAGDALRLVQANYAAGLDSYLDVLNANAQYHQAVIGDLQAAAARYQDTVALYVAVGGDWWNPGFARGENAGHPRP